MRFFVSARRNLGNLGRRTKLIYLCGLLLSLYLALATTTVYVGDGKKAATEEMRLHGDVENLYEASAAASWADAPRWWIGPWNHPNAGYYRPLTSMLFLAEQKAFGTNFRNFNRISWLMHALNAGLLYTLGFLIVRGQPLIRAGAGLIAVKFFATSASSYFGAPRCLLDWWPAQNDPLCLIWALASLILLQLYLIRERRSLLWCSLFAFFLAVASKEFGYVTMPCAICLIWYHRRRLSSEMVCFALLAATMYAFRMIVVPHALMPPPFTGIRVLRGVREWLGPFVLQLSAGTYWPSAAAATALLLCQAGFRFRWRWWIPGALSLASACLFAEFSTPGGSWATVFIGDGWRECAADIFYIMAFVLFWKYRAEEPGMAICGCVVVSFIPILGLKPTWYYYLPGAFFALAEAVYFACLVRFARDLWTHFRPRTRSAEALPQPRDSVVQI